MPRASQRKTEKQAAGGRNAPHSATKTKTAPHWTQNGARLLFEHQLPAFGGGR